ncbi:MAG: hypothetical protein ABIF85_06635 [Nanoarchaeota archaeon]|nr:hypothetical protein [Nanoarchaeota archaeon]MBU4451326.1 hypothetical protein [Nanoarchaeota archaeon]MCG2723287.1 hypothetical protein [archaeon]
MKWLAIGFLIFISSVMAFAIPDTASSIWFEGNTSQHYAPSCFNVNWSAVSNEDISNYTVFVVNSLNGKTILKSTNTSATGFIFSGANGMKYQFKIAAINTTGKQGPNATSDWMFVDALAPKVYFYSTSPANGAYMKIKKIWITINVSGSNSNTLINEGSESSIIAGSIAHKVKVDMVSDASTAYITMDSGTSERVIAGNRYIINGMLVYINSISYGSGTNKVGISIAESGLNLILNWNGANETNTFTYYGTYWDVSKILMDERLYTYYVWANDSVGNINISEKRTIRYNPSYQQISLLSPANKTYDALQIPLEYGYFDTGTYLCWYEYNKKNVTLTNCGNSNFSAIRNAASKLTLWIRTSSGNLISQSTTFTTAIPPAIFSHTPENNSMLTPPSLSGNNVLHIGVRTDIISQCGFSTEKGTDFDSMDLFKTTNSTIHNTTMNITDSREYRIFVRCKDMLGNANLEDYYLKYTTLNGSNKLLIDPEEKIAKNGYFRVEVLSDRTKTFNVPIKNIASSTIVKPEIILTGTGADYMIAKLRSDTIPAGSEGTLEVTITPNDLGIFDSKINITKGESSAVLTISITVYKVFSNDLNDLKEKRIALAARLDALKKKNADVDDLISSTETLLSDVNDGISLYNNGKYSTAKEKVDTLRTELENIEEKTIEMEENQKSKDLSNDDFLQTIENSSSKIKKAQNINMQNESINGADDPGNIWIAIGVIFLAIIIIIVATSILPNDYGKKNDAEEDDDQELYLKDK